MLADLNNLMMGLGIALQPYNLLIASIGLILGIIVGVLPGLGGANGVAILIPVVVVMPATTGVILLSSIYWGALYGGSITSILFNIPGEPWSVATTFDGYPMAKKGRAGLALVLSFLSHAVGAIGRRFSSHLSCSSNRGDRPEVRSGRDLLRHDADLQRLCGSGRQIARQDRGGHFIRVLSGGGRNGYCQRSAPPHLRIGRPDGRVQLHRGGHRSLRPGGNLPHRRRGAEGRGDRGPGRHEGHRGRVQGAPHLSKDPFHGGDHRMLDGGDTRRGHAGLIHVVRICKRIGEEQGRIRPWSFRRASSPRRPLPTAPGLRRPSP